ncbi:DUF5954 family protein [Actinocorallia longicatena]|uniref:Uncharacterized protein n=1 Tax=Actinocorallia longicatena TaxID=111803 RepID=A0ABP6QAR0_9ACTN
MDDDALYRDLADLSDPVRAVAAQDALRAHRAYPLMVLAGPMFGVAEETPHGWQIISLGEATPQCSRDDLANHLRRLGPSEEYQEAARVLDWERHDEMTVAGRRFRVVRVEQVLRMNETEPEPPRPTDLDPRSAYDHPMELLPAFPRSEPRSLLSTQFTAALSRPGFLSDEALNDAHRAAATHPFLFPMRPAFSVAEYLHDGWRAATAACPTPTHARNSLADYLLNVLPVLEHPDPETAAAYARAAHLLTGARLDELEVQGRRFRIVRLEKVARLGPDGPELPRPSDFDPDPPVEILALQLKAEGLLEE